MLLIFEHNCGVHISASESISRQTTVILYHYYLLWQLWGYAGHCRHGYLNLKTTPEPRYKTDFWGENVLFSKFLAVCPTIQFWINYLFIYLFLTLFCVLDGSLQGIVNLLIKKHGDYMRITFLHIINHWNVDIKNISSWEQWGPLIQFLSFTSLLHSFNKRRAFSYTEIDSPIHLHMIALFWAWSEYEKCESVSWLTWSTLRGVTDSPDDTYCVFQVINW